MAHSESVRVVASLLRASNDTRPVFLLGAGASFSSGVPLAAESVRRLARRVFAEKVKGGALLPEQVKLTEWQLWLRSQPWFIPGEDRLAENFPLIVEHALEPREYRKRLLLELLRPSSGIGPGYQRLADLVVRGLVRTILTTNFDECIPSALNEKRPHLVNVAEVNRHPGDLAEFSVYARAQVVWLHGRAEQYTDRNLAGETQRLDAGLVAKLVPLLDGSPVIVVGYRGAERSVIHHLLIGNARSTQRFRNGIYWCVRPGEVLHSNVERLRKAIGGNFRLLEISGFDELITDVAREVRDEDLYSSANLRDAATKTAAFDDEPCRDTTFDDLDADLMLSVMREYCAKLGRAPVTSDTLQSLLIEQGLLASIDGKPTPTAGCLLLFGKDPQARFPHAVVAGTIAGKKRVVFGGSLVRQRLALLEWLDSEDVNPVLRVKKRATHEEKPAYPARALVELLVNMLVHRDYAINDVTAVDVQPGQSITFRNPGGLVEKLASRINTDAEGRFRPLPGEMSELRNRSLCDVFFGIRAMEREGTGLADVEQLARDAGGEATFMNDAAKNAFVATIRQPAASGGSKSVARDGRPAGVYVFNALPFASMPERVTILRLTTSLYDRPEGINLDGAGTFVHRAGGDLWSFAPLMVLRERFNAIMDPALSREISRSQIEADPDSRRVLSWLLRKHFERHLARFEDVGLRIEDGNRTRAYFEGENEGPRTFTYNTARKRGVSRQVVKRRGDDVRTWFENEGFGYEVSQIGDRWAIRVKPFYMFTGRDARTPLPAFTRAARATRRMKLDRNKNVDDDLTFWARFLGEGRPTINIGQEHVNDLILDGMFFTVEIVEEGARA